MNGNGYTASEWARLAQSALENEALIRARDELAKGAIEACCYTQGEDEIAQAARREARYTLRVLSLMEDKLKEFVKAAPQ